ncbi:hypothetical protein QJS04_geneDACA009621 [Acorus gramineus]|uniref:3-dehydroquinate synthase domain-containing protein n=1 Tax=Acorus gramineus TaxID=55184 RepID=A0AAV9BDX2_ACOGR|nr:hypothetical protein QJS04_geneDACA009621 [Acorus gramineus]
MKVFDKAIASRVDQRCTFVALGSGVIGDMGGFAAAAYLHDVNFIQLPTTLMAQVDSSVGGKTEVNPPLGKILIGAFFYHPQCVLIDTDTLNTLLNRELASGTLVHLHMLLTDHVKIKLVSLDEKESGLRTTLNLGHTFGHAIETGFGYGQWIHGEAVAGGTVMAVDMLYRLGWIDVTIIKRVLGILEQAKLTTAPPEVDKKVADGLLQLILLKGPLGNSSCFLQTLIRSLATAYS